MQDDEHDIEELTSDLARLRIAFVNVYFVGAERKRTATPWVLVDAGLTSGAAQILGIAAERYGPEVKPSAVILTHGHFDHVGALEALLGVWDVPVYAHALELPFLTGRSDYPPPDPTVGRGLVARLSPAYPERGTDFTGRVQPLPGDGTVPGMPGWRWVHTPGHSPGHVSLFRDADRTLVAGDAICTTRQDSVFSVVTQRKELNGPPAYFTIDWDKARQSAQALAALQPSIIATGHGEPMTGAAAAEALAALAADFDRQARPRKGRYVSQPVATDEDGVVMLPPPPRERRLPWGTMSGVAAAAVAGTWLYRRFNRRTPTS